LGVSLLGRCGCPWWCRYSGRCGCLGGIGAQGAPCTLYWRASGISSSSSSSLSVRPATTLRHFWLLSSSSIINGPLVPRGSVDFLFLEGPSSAGRFPAAFLVIRGSRASTPAGQSSAGMLETYTIARSWPWILQASDLDLWLWTSNCQYQIDTVGDFRHTCGGGAVNLYAFIMFDSWQYPVRPNSCANHQFTSSRERILADSLVGSPNPKYSYNGCTRSLHSCTRLQMKFRATVGPSSWLLSNNPSSSSTYTISALEGLVDQLSCCSGIGVTSQATNGSCSCCT
jgi:hypothetical protein